ncbi:hypothetical protein ILYODFUR_007883 [Ilyodon furcidens]|uniref:Uncharacterized protein n=1 Tax=Ilyodon furcidens TaxID=33524 RepID=A0ABV0T671_9TELE
MVPSSLQEERLLKPPSLPGRRRVLIRSEACGAEDSERQRGKQQAANLSGNKGLDGREVSGGIMGCCSGSALAHRLPLHRLQASDTFMMDLRCSCCNVEI